MQQSFHRCSLHLYSVSATYNKQLHKVTRAVLTTLAAAIGNQTGGAASSRGNKTSSGTMTGADPMTSGAASGKSGGSGGGAASGSNQISTGGCTSWW